MKLGMMGLGRMGMNMATRLLRGGHEVVVYNRSPQKALRLAAEEGAIAAQSPEEMVSKLQPPRIVWLMLPAGKPVEVMIDKLQELLSEGDVIVDGGNTMYKDDLRRRDSLKKRNIGYLDAGVSGGIWGLKVGYCLMIGGEKELFKFVEPVFSTLAPLDGYLHCGGTGSGHFVKMVHNGIEYGMMQAYAEGFELLEASDYSEDFDYGKISRLWNQGSVVRSWLLELLEDAFSEDPRLESIRGYVEDSGEGRWTVQQAVETGVPIPVIAGSLFQRFRSRQENTFADRVLAGLRREFGGHPVKTEK